MRRAVRRLSKIQRRSQVAHQLRHLGGSRIAGVGNLRSNLCDDVVQAVGPVRLYERLTRFLNRGIVEDRNVRYGEVTIFEG
jgi:hypothetical protein